MQVRSRSGKRNVKLYADEKRAILRAIEICEEAKAFFLGGEIALVAVRAADSLNGLLKRLTEPEPEVVG